MFLSNPELKKCETPPKAASLFSTELDLQEDRLDGEAHDFWWLTAPLIWQDSKFGTLTAPTGFRTDLASIPRIVRNIPFLDPDGISRRAAALHDWLYAWQKYSKAFADEFLRAALTSEGTNVWSAGCYYYAVSWFGQSSWNKDSGQLGVHNFEPGYFDVWKHSSQSS